MSSPFSTRFKGSPKLSNERLFDLVRYMRAELHEVNLITDEEYVMLASDSASVQRLEDYDKLRAKLDSFTHF